MPNFASEVHIYW